MTLVKIIAAPFWIAGFVMADVVIPVGKATAGVMKGAWKQKSADASFASLKDLKRSGYLEPRGFMPGLQDGKRVFLDGESSAIVFGSRGSGKTQTLIANLKAIEPGPDLIIADPVGDIERATDLAEKGYRVIRLDLTDPRGSDKYDPLTFLRPELVYDFPRDVMTLCGLMLPSIGNENDAGIHFLESARAMLQSMVMWRAENPGKGFSLGEIVVRLTADKKARTDEFAEMKRGRHVLIRQGVEAFEGAGDRERGSMDSTLSRKLRPFLDDAVCHITRAHNQWSFEDVFSNPQPVAIFIRSGLGNEDFGGPLVRLVVGNAINTARRLWNQTGKPLPKGLWLFVDEARSMGNCQAAVDAVNELRKARVNVFMTFHTLADVKQTYSAPHALLSGCAWVINGGSRDLALYKEASALAGDKTTISKTVNKGERKSESEHEVTRPLIKPDEFQRLAQNECIVLGHGIIAKLEKPWRIQNGGVRFL